MDDSDPPQNQMSNIQCNKIVNIIVNGSDNCSHNRMSHFVDNLKQCTHFLPQGPF